jgi:hypothetical protein
VARRKELASAGHAHKTRYKTPNFSQKTVNDFNGKARDRQLPLLRPAQGGGDDKRSDLPSRFHPFPSLTLIGCAATILRNMLPSGSGTHRGRAWATATRTATRPTFSDVGWRICNTSATGFVERPTSPGRQLGFATKGRQSPIVRQRHASSRKIKYRSVAPVRAVGAPSSWVAPDADRLWAPGCRSRRGHS